MGNQCKSLLVEDPNSTLFIYKKDSPKKTKIIQDIENLKSNIISISLFERDKIAKTKYENFMKKYNSESSKDISILQKYIDIMELLLLNNTDKDIVKLYLNFLKNNNNFIKDFELNTYEEEIMKYKILFSVKEMETIENNLKIISEKQKLINFFKTFSKAKLDDKFSLYIKNEFKNIYYFNYPIEFCEEELFYYKLYILIIKELYNNIKEGEKYFDERRKVAEYVYINDIFNNKDIINSEDKMNILIILILYDKLNEKGESINFNRLLQTKDITIDDIKNYIIENKIKDIIIKEQKESPFPIIFFDNKKKEKKGYYIEIKNPNDFCLKNLNNKDLKKSDNEYLLYNINSLLKENGFTKFVEIIRAFLKKLINSNVYEKAITLLFPHNYKFILHENINDMQIFINNRLKFYPYQGLNNSGLTEKFSLYSYIPILFFDIYCKNQDLENSLKISAVIENSMLEINHINQDIIFFKGNDKNLFPTPKRKGLKGENGGEYLEELLFGEKIKYLRILESLYILNEDNYAQNIEDFKQNFQNIYNNSIDFSQKKKYLRINENGIFKGIFIDIDNYSYEEIQKIELSSIALKSQQSNLFDAYISFPKEVCKMGA